MKHRMIPQAGEIPNDREFIATICIDCGMEDIARVSEIPSISVLQIGDLQPMSQPRRNGKARGENMEQKEGRRIVGLSTNLFFYEDDPLKLIYRRENGSWNWIKFMTRNYAEERLTETEADLVQDLRKLYDDITGNRLEIFDTIMSRYPKIVQYVPEELARTDRSPNREEHLAEREQAKQPPEKKEQGSHKPSDRPKLMAKLNGIPEELANMYFAVIDGNLYVKAPGLLYMASRKGYARILTESEPDEETGGWKAETRIYPEIPVEVIKSLGNLSPDMQNRILTDYYGPTVGRGTASKENLKEKQYPHMREMAETRSVVRAARLYTGYGGTAAEEMPDAEYDEGTAQTYSKHLHNIKRTD